MKRIIDFAEWTELFIILAENVAKQWNISRKEQDLYSVNSQQNIAKSQREGFFNDEIVPVTVATRKGDSVLMMKLYLLLLQQEKVILFLMMKLYLLLLQQEKVVLF